MLLIYLFLNRKLYCEMFIIAALGFQKLSINEI